MRRIKKQKKTKLLVLNYNTAVEYTGGIYAATSAQSKYIPKYAKKFMRDILGPMVDYGVLDIAGWLDKYCTLVEFSNYTDYRGVEKTKTLRLNYDVVSSFWNIVSPQDILNYFLVPSLARHNKVLWVDTTTQQYFQFSKEKMQEALHIGLEFKKIKIGQIVQSPAVKVDMGYGRRGFYNVNLAERFGEDAAMLKQKYCGVGPIAIDAIPKDHASTLWGKHFHIHKLLEQIEEEQGEALKAFIDYLPGGWLDYFKYQCGE